MPAPGKRISTTRGKRRGGARARGFTLIELLVVMAIIATLLSIAAPRYFDHLDRSREAALRQSLSVMRDALDKFKADTGRFPHELGELVDRRYLRNVPKDPVTDSAETWVAVPEIEEVPGAGTGGIRDVHSGAEGLARDGSAYAEW
ncbi:type II secretion system protein [Thauera sinica]|uniref:Type II secretion system protein n=1 Tax=Thauera sinica TaxID=2665146 RepID=A0ABW1ANH6_9RHOO|nr:type II secretion system protein G [Thauera sp. K11]